MDLSRFKRMDFLPAVKGLFNDLQVPVNYLADEPTSARTILKDTWKDNDAFNLIQDVYFLGMVDDAAFAGNKSMDASKIQSDYDGVLIFGVALSQRENNRLPTRSQLAQIAWAFNREYFYTPVIVIFKYDGYLGLANTQRLKYKQEWREGEKAGKVSLLRDIDLNNPHAGHLRILNDLKIPKTGKNKVDSFAKLYAYWQDVFNVNILNKKFYQELSNWYFWAVKEVAFPSEPTKADEHLKKIDLDILQQEHNAKNVIRLLTRFLFVWFVKEKKLIPEELFDSEYLKNELLKDISPVRDEGLFKEANTESVYYKAILQNLFFASLNCPIEPSETGDNRKRGFRLKENFGQHRDANYLMRYQGQFKNPEKFLELINSVVPFLNGGLFECLDNKTDKIYIDGFSDNLVKPHRLIVPDYLFFGFDHEVDLSGVVGINTNAYKNARVKGLIPLLESYKFTVAENTPIEEDVALDPELLGKVFENLLASYNPETKTTARKQTGSFYTPREIVNYMVDESLIAYLKNSVKNWGDIEDENLDKQLHELLSYDEINPFAKNSGLQKQIIHALDDCKILDPACGSGAFPMGVLQKMVHVLQKLDPANQYWQELQLNKAVKETEGAFALADKKEREQKLIEINEAFDEKINDPDYARKLFLVENCIYGVDIQPIATQIFKLRFFISLVVDQKVDKAKPNFGIRALPNLETKFVAANTLIGIDKPEAQMTPFDNQEIKELEQELKKIRHRLFSAKTPATKRRWRDKDKEIREKIGNLLVEHGWGNQTAKQLAAWDPYDQNASSPFFNPEWMFGIRDGFDVVIGNPPYGVSIKGPDRKEVLQHLPKVPDYEIYYFFIEVSKKILSNTGVLSYIIPNTYLFNVFAEKYRTDILDYWNVGSIIDLTNYSLFACATVRNSVFVFNHYGESDHIKYLPTQNEELSLQEFINQEFKTLNQSLLREFSQNWALAFKLPKNVINAVAEIKNSSNPLNHFFPDFSQGLIAYDKYQGQDSKTIETRAYHFKEYRDGLKKWLWGEDVTKYKVKWNGKEYIDYCQGIANPRKPKYFKGRRLLIREITNPSIYSAVTESELYNDPAVIIVMESKFSLETASIILNSILGSFYHFNASPKATKGDFPKILVKDIKEFPITKNITTVDVSFFNLIYDLASFSIGDTSSFYDSIFTSIVDALVFQLYFPEHMKDRNIDILQFVEKDLKEVMQNREFDELTDDQKEKTINQLHARWTDPKSEIVKRMNSFAEKSPEILKPILESGQKGKH
jgi:uncharacterized protein YihD (DUF1040 family)